jgi:hypothetical protein
MPACFAARDVTACERDGLATWVLFESNKKENLKKWCGISADGENGGNSGEGDREGRARRFPEHRVELRLGMLCRSACGPEPRYLYLSVKHKFMYSSDEYVVKFVDMNNLI